MTKEYKIDQNRENEYLTKVDPVPCNHLIAAFFRDSKTKIRTMPESRHSSVASVVVGELLHRVIWHAKSRKKNQNVWRLAPVDS